MFCKKCGKSLKDGAKFCPYCGAPTPVHKKTKSEKAIKKPEYKPVEKEANPPAGSDDSIWGNPSEDEISEKKKFPIVLLLILLIVIIVAATVARVGYEVWKNNKDAKPIKKETEMTTESQAPDDSETAETVALSESETADTDSNMVESETQTATETLMETKAAETEEKSSAENWQNNQLKEEHGAKGSLGENGDVAEAVPYVFGVEDWVREEIEYIKFLDSTKQAPDNAVDISETGNGSVVGWIDDQQTLYIAGNGGVKAPDDCSALFAWCTSLKEVDFNHNFHTDDTNDMRYMFYHCSSLEKLDMSGLNIGKVTSMAKMFVECSDLEDLNLTGIDTHSCKSFYAAFNKCYGLEELDLSSFNTSKVLTFEMMFYNCENLKTIEVDPALFRADSAGNTRSMFSHCKSLGEIDLSGFDISDVSVHSGMFKDCPLGDTYGTDGDDL